MLFHRIRKNDAFWASCVNNMLLQCQDQDIVTKEHALDVIGKQFRVAIADRIAPWETDRVLSFMCFSICLGRCYLFVTEYGGHSFE